MNPNPQPHGPQQPVQPELVSPYPPRPSQPAPPAPVVVVHRPNGFLRFISWMGWLGLMLCVPIILGMMGTMHEYFDTTNGIQEKFHSGKASASSKVAIIHVDGVIMDGRGYVKNQIDRVRKDKRVKAIVLRIDSPGGTITGSDYIHHHLRKLREEKELPMVVSMGSVAASGGYYVAMAAGDAEDTIFAEPTTATGSIGVIIPHYDISGLLSDFNVVDDSIATHPRKQMLSMTKPLSDDDRKVLKEYLNEYFVRFKDIIKDGRAAFQQDEAKLDELATGEVFTATQALDNGLIDKIGFIEDAIDRAAELAGLDKEKVRVVQFKRPLTLMDALVNAQAHGSELSQLLDRAAPRAYYLASTLPALVSTHGP